MGLKAQGWLLAGFLAFALPACGGQAQEPPVAFAQDKLAIKSRDTLHRFTVEIAKTPQQQQYGFMHRTQIPADHGMLFIEDRDAVIKMWMKDTPLPLDMLFIDRRGKILFIATAQSNSLDVIGPPRPVRAVLELPAGTAQAESIHTGDRVIHSYFTAP